MPFPAAAAAELCKLTGVTLAKGSRVVIMPDNGGVADELTQSWAHWGWRHS